MVFFSCSIDAVLALIRDRMKGIVRAAWMQCTQTHKYTFTNECRDATLPQARTHAMPIQYGLTVIRFLRQFSVRASAVLCTHATFLSTVFFFQQILLINSILVDQQISTKFIATYSFFYSSNLFSHVPNGMKTSQRRNKGNVWILWPRIVFYNPTMAARVPFSNLIFCRTNDLSIVRASYMEKRPIIEIHSG